MTRRETVARNRRDLHRRRIDVQPDPLRRVAWAWAWVYAELRDLVRVRKTRRKAGGRTPAEVLDAVLAEVVDLAERLNKEGAGR